MTQTNRDLAGDIYYETRLSIPQQIELLKPLLTEWIGEACMGYYIPEIQFFSYRPRDKKITIAVGWNPSYGKSSLDNDRFSFQLVYIDDTGQLTEEQYLQRMTQALELFWSHGIPTCTPGWTEELPNGGGEEGPVKWP